MTNHWIDLQHSNCILIMGSNAAEHHPIAFKWILRAKEKTGAKIIHVDPRFTRTSARCDYHVSLRSGTDIAFLGGMINYILTNEKYFRDYVVNYTNAPFIVSRDFGFDDGLFTGYDKNAKKYSKDTWTFEKDAAGIPLKDPTLRDPRCVFQLLKKHYSRYTPDMVSSITGVSTDDLMKVYQDYTTTGAGDRAGTICYALGWTHHTTGTQNIRTMAIVQLLLGNMGVCGGGINALRGEPNVQGSTDHCILYNLLPGYLKMPSASMDTLDKYLTTYTPVTHDPHSPNYYRHYPQFYVSFLKSLFGNRATRENEFGYSWMPKLDDGVPYSLMHLFDAMYKGTVKGLFSVGTDPAVSSPNANKVRKALTKLDWLVSANIFDNETCSFWKGPGMDPSKIKTECFLLPASASMEKEGSQTNSGRWIQWKYEAAEAPGEAIPVGEIMIKIMQAVKRLYALEGGVHPDAILNLKWDYTDLNGRFSALKTAKEINGYFLEDTVVEGTGNGSKQVFKKGQLVPTFGLLRDDGTTSGGNWLMAGSFGTHGENKMARRGKDDPTGLGLYPNWSFAWPVNRRILYNRASCDIYGRPYNPGKKLLEWTGTRWVGDVPDGPWPPQADPREGKYPFIMKPDGVASIFGPGMAEGPFSEHYEPLEGPLSKNPLSGQLNNPAIHPFDSDMDKVAKSAGKEFPLVCTTYSCTEHWCSGALTRWQAWLLEMQPEAYVEISENLAKEKGIKNGERVTVSSARGSVQCVAMVTKRFRPFQVAGKTVHQVGLPFNYGWLFPEDGGDSCNLLTPSVGDANTSCPEYKAFMVNVTKL